MRVLAVCLLLQTGVAGGCASNGPDPLERMNRPIFAFNEGLDRFIVAPVAKGWDFIMPGFAQTGVDNFFENLAMIRTAVNDLLQGKPGRAGADLGRFVTNTTIGIVGFFDPATRFGIPHFEEDFGQTLGVWGAGPGPFLVLPFFGPSSGRDFAGMPVDFLLHPTTYGIPVGYGLNLVDVVNTRAEYLEEIAESRRTALDYYVFVRDAYLQNRAQRVADGEDTGSEEEEDWFDVDVDDDLEEAEASAEDPAGE